MDDQRAGPVGAEDGVDGGGPEDAAAVAAASEALATSIWAVALGTADALPEELAGGLRDGVSAAIGAGPVYAALRRDGRQLAAAWGDGDDHGAALTAALSGARAQLSAARLAEVDAIELCLTGDYQAVNMGDQAARARLHANLHRGVRGIEVKDGAGGVVRVSPTTTIATNRKHEKWVEFARQQLKLTVADIRRAPATVRTFTGAQLLLRREPGAPPLDMLLRGKPLVAPSDVSKDMVVELERLWGDYLVRSVQPDGRMLYIYYPSRGEEDQKRNNMIRQWMATLALVRMAGYRRDKRLARLAEDNIRYNLRTFYHATGKLGLIEYNKKVKLGAVALAVMSLMEHPQRARFKRIEPKLWATIEHLWREGGAFRTFFKPAERNDVQNFYPGEALLAWAQRYEETKDAALLEKIMASFRHYREWHRAQRNPAFVPWHTQAYYKIWRRTRDAELREFVFEMSDWLIEVMQQWDGVAYPDMQGRFHSPVRTDFGPPHASSTGVYMEGLIDAFEMARALGEEDRVAHYRRALLRALRSARQLTFLDARDMYYVQKREPLRGGVRTTIYDNVVRVDNVQHNLLAIFKILAAFTDEDWGAVATIDG
ncbi:MAG: hypothetical protein H6713_31710 [Myxococcales bacterium]|nr:hypothetical protein [Myxococcales bacterium]